LTNNRVGNDFRRQNVGSIRNRYSDVNRRPFGNDYWDRRGPYHTGSAWRFQSQWRSYPSNWYWRTASVAACGSWFAGWNWNKPYYYNYGSNVVYRDNSVYINDQQYASTEQFYEQAETIASNVPQEAVETKEEDWMPLGVFALAREDGEDSGMMLQLAVTKEGVIAGMLYNDTSDEDRPVEGSVDQKTQRAVWRFADGKNENLVMETGIYNLTEEEATALVHFGPDETEDWLMVRLEESSDQK
jgi:hypothetical protein